ncbi:MAG: hypothetical protein ACFFDR_03600 [Candidatus Thorarchaeota archaeon]
MQVIETAEAILIALDIVLGLLLALFIYQTIRKSRQAHLLSLGLIFGFIGVTLFAIEPFLPSGNPLGANVSVLVNGVFYVLMLYCIYLHFEQVVRLTPRLERLAIMSALLGIGLSTSFIILTTSSPSVGLGTVNDLAHDLSRMLTFTFATYVSFRGWLLTRERGANIEWISLIILTIGSVPTAIANHTDLSSLDGLSLYELGDLITFVGLVLLVSIYIRKPDYLYRMPVPIHDVILYNAAGIAVYSRLVQNKGFESAKVPEHLMSMAVTAISTLLSESLQTDAQLELIESRNRTLLFETQGELTVLLICDRATYFVRRSLRILLRSINETVYKRLTAEDFHSDRALVSQVDQYVAHALPYLIFLES